MIFTALGAVAELERNLIQERIHRGLPARQKAGQAARPAQDHRGPGDGPGTVQSGQQRPHDCRRNGPDEEHGPQHRGRAEITPRLGVKRYRHSPTQKVPQIPGNRNRHVKSRVQHQEQTADPPGPTPRRDWGPIVPIAGNSGININLTRSVMPHRLRFEKNP